ncbi:MAG: hypothetical protein J0I00_00435 [Burkholderiales bacterium]|uniref:Ribbon-helix-helix protein, CopG family n=1 Tax=Ottowia pentelensis TaxID=511108 RepID=A0ABV6PML5_9BURK|nr:hypothetical protein [Burkholderiales bacterium]MBS0404505.1 hypothetical protein [Pseudomonadota bacterium]MBS0412913.1 hypothetical protein [Pseudomonadota bacterium]HMN57418.1 CopG family transcriptional regulator [Ottowia sp.]
MAVSVRMDPLLEKELELAAQRKGVTKSQFITDAVERALGRKNPYDLLLQVKAEAAAQEAQPPFAAESGFQGDLSDPDATRAFITSKLRRKHGLGPA